MKLQSDVNKVYEVLVCLNLVVLMIKMNWSNPVDKQIARLESILNEPIKVHPSRRWAYEVGVAALRGELKRLTLRRQPTKGE